VLETGVWLATEMMSFDSYGSAPGALSLGASAFGLGRPPFGPRGLLLARGVLPTGGLATFRIRLLPVSQPIRTAVLQVNCTLGAPPPSRSIEGIRLTLDRNGPEFSEEAGGRVMFLSRWPESSVPASASGRHATPVPTETTSN
jgi:hypothetical protein